MLPLRMLGILMLMFLLCDADSSCPITLDPPEVIGEYGDTVLVNCSSSEEFHDGLVLKLGNTYHNDNDDENFVSGPLTLSDWSVTAECRIKLSETLECSRELGITIYKTPDTVTVSAVDDGPMVEGREYTLECNIINVAPLQNLTVIWYRDNEKLSTETFNGNALNPVNEYSTLTVTADRHHNGALFRCEAVLHLGPELNLTTTSKPYTAVVQYGPSFAFDDHYEVKEGDFPQTICEPEGLPQPDITWLKDGKEIPTPQRWTRHDIGRYSLRATNKHGTATHALYLDVLYCPLILTPAEVVVRFGDPVSVNCSVASTTDFLGMGWEAAFGGTGFEQKSSLTWTVEKVEEWNIYPQCYMTRKNGEQCSVTPDVTVYKTPDTVTLSGVGGGPMVERSAYMLDCNIANVAPVQNLTVIWYRDNEKLFTEMFNENTVTPVTVSSSLRLTADRHHNGALFRCEAEQHLGPELNLTTTSLSYPAVVLYAPLIINCSGPFIGVEGKFSLNMLPCRADANPPATIQWYYQLEEIEADKLLNRSDSGEYTAVFKNGLGKGHISINITIE